MQSKALTVAQYLKELPPEKRKVISFLRKTIKGELLKGYKEVMQYGMITYVVPLSSYPQGYLSNKKMPLPYLSLASQKNHFAIYLMNIYADKELQRKFTKLYKASGKKLNMGKSCLTFISLDELSLDAIKLAVSYHTPQEWIAVYEKGRGSKN